MNEKEFYIIADEYISKLGEIAKKQGIRIFTSVIIIDSENGNWYKGIDWKNMDEPELLKASAIISSEIIDRYNISTTDES